MQDPDLWQSKEKINLHSICKDSSSERQIHFVEVHNINLSISNRLLFKKTLTRIDKIVQLILSQISKAALHISLAE